MEEVNPREHKERAPLQREKNAKMNPWKENLWKKATLPQQNINDFFNPKVQLHVSQDGITAISSGRQAVSDVVSIISINNGLNDYNDTTLGNENVGIT